jgi:hypothetical protein
VLTPGADGGDGDDRRERSGLCLEMRQPDHEGEGGNEEDPATHAEHARKDARSEAEQDGERDRHPRKSRTAMPKRSRLKSPTRRRDETRCWTEVPMSVPTIAGNPTRAA